MSSKFVFLILSITILLGLTSPKVSAQDLNGLSVSPALIMGPQNLNETKEYTFRLISDGEKTIYITLKLLHRESNVSSTVITDEVPEEFTKWFEFQKQIRIVKGEDLSYKVKVTAPEGFLGNYNFALVFTESNPTYEDNSNTTFASSEVAVPVILNIKDEGQDFYEALNVEKLNVAPEVSFDGRNSFDIKLMNAGMTYLIPRGVLKVEALNTLVGSEAENISINSNKQVLLRGSAFVQDIEKNFTDYSFGRYRATLAVAYGTNNEVITKEIYFWKFPQWFIVLVAVLIISATILIFRRIYKYRKK